MNARLLIIASLLIFFNSCHKDTVTENSSENVITGSTNYVQEEGDIQGLVSDFNGDPVADAEVSVAGFISSTDEHGFFKFQNILLNPGGNYLKVQKDGFILGSDYIYPTGGIAHSHIKLISLSTDQTFSSTEGGQVEVSDGGTINFPDQAIVNIDGSSFEGQVNVRAQRIATDNPNVSDLMPGDLLGIDHEGKNVVLGTLGMIAVELYDDAGNELQLKEGSSAEIIVPIADDDLDVAPAQIPLWHFDEDIGMWIEEGIGIREGNQYKATVSHFSFWNWDAPFPIIRLDGKILLSNGEPAANFKVGIKASGIGTKYGWTDSEGNFGGDVPKGVALELSVFDPNCDEDFDKQIIGPFINNIALNDIIINVDFITISGKVSCLGEAQENANIFIKTDAQNYFQQTDAEGNYTIYLASVNCATFDDFEIFAYDGASQNASQAQNFSIDFTGAIDMEICSFNCDHEVSIIADLSTLCPSGTASLMAEVVNGSGNFSYNWTTGLSGANVSINEGMLYCVTVTDNDAGCDKIACDEIIFNNDLSLSVDVTQPVCGGLNGSFNILASGGVGPYSYTVDGPGGIIVDQTEFTNVDLGTYQITVVDVNDCIVIQTVTLNDIGQLQCNLTAIDLCGFGQIATDCDGSNLNFLWSDGSTGDMLEVFVPGTYCVTITNQNGCDFEDCVVLNIEQIPEIFSNGSCTDNIYDFSFTDLLAQVEINGANGINLVFQDQFNLGFDVLEFGYSAEVNMITFNGCQNWDNIDLPEFEGLSITNIQNTTCGTCEDGFVTFNIDALANCSSCEIGEVSIFEVNDLNTDLKTLNDNQQLPSGSYQLVVRDLNSGCFIANEAFNIE